MMKKFEFTGETKTIQLASKTVTLHRIRAVADFGLVKIGDIGGWLEKKENLSQEDNAWVYGNAKVCGDANVYGNAKVWDDAKVSGNAWVYGNAKVCGDANVYGDAKVLGNANVWGNAKVYGDANVWGNAEVCGNANVWGNAWVYGDAKVWGNAEVCGNANVCGNAEVFSSSHVMVIGAIGSRNDFTTFYRGKGSQIMVKCGCFNDTINKFLEKVNRTHGNTKHALVYQKAAELAKIQIDLESEDK